MQRPTWEEFSALFADRADAAADAVKAEFLKAHPVATAPMTLSPGDYRADFMSVYGIRVDWKEGFLSLLECLQECLGNTVFSLEIDDDHSTGKVSFGSRSLVFHDSEMGSDAYDESTERLTQLLRSQFAFRVNVEDGISDTLEFLVVPTTWWARAEKIHGEAHVAAYFTPYGYEFQPTDTEDVALPEAAVLDDTVTKEPAPLATSTPPEKSRRPLTLPLAVGLALWIALAAVYLWPRLFETKPSASAHCENVSQVFRHLPPEQATHAEADMRKQLGCP